MCVHVCVHVYVCVCFYVWVFYNSHWLRLQCSRLHNTQSDFLLYNIFQCPSLNFTNNQIFYIQYIFSAFADSQILCRPFSIVVDSLSYAISDTLLCQIHVNPSCLFWSEQLPAKRHSRHTHFCSFYVNHLFVSLLQCLSAFFSLLIFNSNYAVAVRELYSSIYHVCKAGQVTAKQRTKSENRQWKLNVVEKNVARRNTQTGYKIISS